MHSPDTILAKLTDIYPIVMGRLQTKSDGSRYAVHEFGFKSKNIGWEYERLTATGWTRMNGDGVNGTYFTKTDEEGSWMVRWIDPRKGQAHWVLALEVAPA